MRIPLWPGVRLSVWERQNPDAVQVTMSNTVLWTPHRRVLSMRGWMLLLVRYDWRKSGRYFHPGPVAGLGTGVREVRIRVTAPTDENAGQWAQTIADLVAGEYGQEMRLDIQISAPGPAGKTCCGMRVGHFPGCPVGRGETPR